MVMTVNLSERSYDIVLERGILKKAGELLNLDRKVLIITDSGVPAEYAQTVAAVCKDASILTVPSGEDSKGFTCLQEALTVMLNKNFTRKDCVVAVGGGVVGDLAGFVAASYMRGVDFYNIPTTVLSQVDSSIGGKTAINMAGVKNIVGAFWQPKKVLIDFDVLNTLPQRQIANGLAEAIKMAATFDADLFEKFEAEDAMDNIDEIICRAVDLKRKVVEVDEKEAGLRRVLNFGHTLGHGIESEGELKGMYHGECVAIGMLAMTTPEIKERLLRIYEKVGLPTEATFDVDTVMAAVTHDKKGVEGAVNSILVEKVGEYIIKKMTYEELRERLLTLV